MFAQFWRSVHAVLLLATAAVSQAALTVSPSPVLVAGQSAEVVYDNPAKPNENVEVHVKDGNGHTATVTVSTDGDGHGSATWTVPKWDDAVFTAQGAQDVYRPIAEP
jgi:hypothetical protein